ncbi:MAG: hypothetical protein M1820_001452 [Bogoriella megaspora]|nr:MAG: hypothetical protein M1820_001452 [Bogoriella megaspora]
MPQAWERGLRVLNSSKNEGKTIYDVGKCATNVTYADGFMTVEMEDILNGSNHTVRADLVVLADGANSIIRQNLLPKVQEEYARYVAWRSTVPEEKVSQETRKLFDKKYAMPGPEGSLEIGNRYFNYVWYYNLPKAPPDFTEATIYKDSHLHQSTLPAGQMREERWAKLVAHANEILISDSLFSRTC